MENEWLELMLNTEIINNYFPTFKDNQFQP